LGHQRTSAPQIADISSAPISGLQAAASENDSAQQADNAARLADE